jgi:hypothetical protein
MRTTGKGRVFAVFAVSEFHYKMPCDPLKTISAWAEIWHSADAHISEIAVSECRFSILPYQILFRKRGRIRKPLSRWARRQRHDPRCRPQRAFHTCQVDLRVD